jgi:hypothetical protein
MFRFRTVIRVSWATAKSNFQVCTGRVLYWGRPTESKSQQPVANRQERDGRLIPAPHILRFLGGQLWEADRCVAMACVTTSGIVSRT